MTIKQSAAAFALLASVALTGAGCASSYSQTGENPKPAATTPAPVAPEETKPEAAATGASVPKDDERVDENGTVTDAELGIAFTVSAAIAPVYATDEFGWGREANETGPLDCHTNRMFSSKSGNDVAVFLTVNDTWECEVPGRDGYWGDQARLFVTEDAVANWCDDKDACETFVNAQGVTIWHASTKSVDDWGDMLTNIDEYAAFNPNKSIHGILISNQGFLKRGLGRQEAATRTIADSLTFLK